MANESTDVLMTFIDAAGTELPAECASIWNRSDSMATDFKVGCFFEIEDFSFGGGLEPDDGSDMDESPAGSNRGPPYNGLSKRRYPREHDKEDDTHRDGDKSKAARGGRGTKFSKYVMDKADPQQFLKLDVPEISVSRQLDKCSPHLFFACMTMHSFYKAVLVKRKIIGGVAAKDATAPMMGFLRFEFYDPLITSIDWEDGDVVKEKFKFVCRRLTMIYKPQKPDGTLGVQVSRTWDATTGRTQTGGSPS